MKELLFSFLVRCNDTIPDGVLLNKAKYQLKQGFEHILEARVIPAAAASAGPAERTCVYCGCTDSRACAGGCSWFEQHPATPTGVCSRCCGKVV